MKIITLSREFGSGGREIGKRLADIFGFDYYDKEIVETVAKKHGVEENYVEKALSNHGWTGVPLRYGRTFFTMPPVHTQTDLLLEERKVIEEIAALGKNCVIVGRNADVILKEYNPFKLFVCAEMSAKIERCKQRGGETENLSDKEIEKKIKRVDKLRKKVREYMTEKGFGQTKSYHLSVNTTGRDLKILSESLAEFIKAWFEEETCR